MNYLESLLWNKNYQEHSYSSSIILLKDNLYTKKNSEIIIKKIIQHAWFQQENL